MRKLVPFTLLLAFFLATNVAYAQTDWRWDNQGVGFSAPSNLRITTNNASEFTAEGKDLFLTLYADQNGEVTEDHLAEALVAAAEAMEYDNISDVDALEIDDYTGFYVEGTKDGSGAFIITLLDKESSTNLVVVIVFTTDAARDKAIDIATSFYALD